MNIGRLQRVRGDGLDLAVRVAGEGPPVVLLHGFPETSHTWRHQVPALVAAGYSVWAPNLRGYPPSGLPPNQDGCALPHLVRDVLALLQATGHPRPHLVGHDWGGIIAWAVAGAHPHAIGRLVILNAPHMQQFRERWWSGLQFLRSFYVGCFQLPWLPEQALAANDYAMLRAMIAHTPARPGAYGSKDIDQYVESLSQPGALKAAFDYYRANMRPGVMDMACMPVRSETMVIWGERDPALSVRLLDGLERHVPRLQVHRLPDAGHFVQNEAPEEVNRLLLDFLNG